MCNACARKVDTLRRYAGTPGVLMVVRDSPQLPWKIIGRTESQSEVVDIGVREGSAVSVSAGVKRARSESTGEAHNAKRPRADDEPEKADAPASPPCLAPQSNPTAQRILSALERPTNTADTLGAGDVFLTDGWRERWCRCNAVSAIDLSLCRDAGTQCCLQCMTSLLDKPYLLEEEETYEPPEDPESSTCFLTYPPPRPLILRRHVSRRAWLACTTTTATRACH